MPDGRNKKKETDAAFVLKCLEEFLNEPIPVVTDEQYRQLVADGLVTIDSWSVEITPSTADDHEAALNRLLSLLLDEEE